LTRAGQFNERVIRHQDFEYNVRLRRMGARLMLVPRVVCKYYARTETFCVHSFRDACG
jgi:succinoglycan biosynthesis protein ExoA